MSRFTLLLFVVIICLIGYSVLNVEAKSQEKNKDKYNKKYKTEGNSKEAKKPYGKYSKYEQNKRKNEKVKEENIEPEAEESEYQENSAYQEQEASLQNKKMKKETKPYTISVELLEEPISEGTQKLKSRTKKSHKLTSEENADSTIKGLKDSKQKVLKDKNRGSTKGKSSPSLEDKTSDFIVHVPKNKKGTRQVLVFQVPMQEEESYEEIGEIETGNAIQHYVSEEQEATNEEDCNFEESAMEDESLQEEELSNNMCYYKNRNK